MNDTATGAPVSAPRRDAGCKLAFRTVGMLRGLFHVPDYQRGYRWVKDDVDRLLDDLRESEGRPYSLQPVVVQRRIEPGADVIWELVDGQQRLTTLFLLLQYMRLEQECGRGAPYRLRYQTRQDSEAFLNDVTAKGHTDDIDLFHLHGAHLAIRAWFEQWGDTFEQNAMANLLHGYLFRSVHVIWYELPPEMEKVTEVFRRLNVGRIPLTDSELIKAALLSAVRKTSPERAHEIAAQWSAIERDLQDSEIWSFVTGLSEKDESYPTRISLLLDTLADQRASSGPGKRPRYFTFDTLRHDVTTKPIDLWSEVVTAHATVLGWYRDPRRFNKMGYLTAVADDGTRTFAELFKASKGQRKRDFDAHLTTQIRASLDTSANDLEELSYERKGYATLLKALLLFNVQTVAASGERFPFAKHARRHWSLEHIHAQNAESLNKADQWKVWLEEHRKVLRAVENEVKAEQIAKLTGEIDDGLARIASGTGAFTRQNFEWLSAKVLALLNRDVAADHTVRNLALLDRGENSALSNSVFEVKRQMVLEFDRQGSYVPICTRNVFLKYYGSEGAKQPHFWSEDDKEAYAAAVQSTLAPYLTESKS